MSFFLVILDTIGLILTAIRYVVIGQFLLYLLLAFNVVSIHNQFVSGAWNFLSTVLDPLLNPIRRRLPPMNGMDFSYMVLLFGVMIVNMILNTLYSVALS